MGTGIDIAYNVLLAVKAPAGKKENSIIVRFIAIIL